MISSHAVVGGFHVIGENTDIWHFANIEDDVVIGNDCVVGSHTYIGRGATIGNRVRIQSFVSICREATIEDDVFISPHCCLTDDKYPRSGNARGYLADPPVLKKGCSLGVGVLVMPGVTIGEGAMVGAGAVVTRDVPPHVTVLGTPARVRA